MLLDIFMIQWMQILHLQQERMNEPYDANSHDRFSWQISWQMLMAEAHEWFSWQIIMPDFYDRNLQQVIMMSDSSDRFSWQILMTESHDRSSVRSKILMTKFWASKCTHSLMSELQIIVTCTTVCIILLLYYLFIFNI